jgi:hypothetical protein
MKCVLLLHGVRAPQYGSNGYFVDFIFDINGLNRTSDTEINMLTTKPVSIITRYLKTRLIYAPKLRN